MQKSEHTAHTTNTLPVAYSGLPIPTNGETMPPNANETAPNNAEALPDNSLPSSIARVVEEVKQRPRENRMPIINNSYIQKLASVYKAMASQIANISRPAPPHDVAFFIGLNLVARAADMTMMSEFSPKTMLN